MKRSSVVYKMLGRILSYNSDTDSPKKLAINILNDLEEIGMLPPIIEDTVLTPEYEGDGDTWVGNQDKYTPVFALQWEPEEEETKANGILNTEDADD